MKKKSYSLDFLKLFYHLKLIPIIKNLLEVLKKRLFFFVFRETVLRQFS